MPAPRAVFVDGSGLLYRAFFALPATLATRSGQPTNAIFGFAQMFRRILQGRTPSFGAVVFDAGGRSFRHELDRSYKAKRPAMPEALRAQLAGVDALVEAHGFPRLQIPGVEADDVIGTLTARALDAGMEVTVVSGDKDLAQLVVDDRVRLFDSTTDVFHDPERVRRRWGVTARQIPDWLALVGDAVDGIPGVPGVGRGTAVDLLARFGSLEGILAASGELGRVGDAVARHAERARLSRRLATLATDVALPVEVDALTVRAPGPDALNAAYRRFEFFSLLTADAPSGARAPEFFVCDTPEMARAALGNECLGPAPVAIHALIELEGHLRGDLTGIAVSPRPGRAFYFPLRGEGSLGPGGLDALRPWLEDSDIPKVAHEGKYALVALRRVGVELRGLVGDTALASYLVDPTRNLPHRLEQVARVVLERALQPLEGVIGRGRERKRFDALTVDRAGAYACHLADATGACWTRLAEQLDEEGLREVLEEVDLPLGAVLAGMEQHGILVDRPALRALGDRFVAERDRVAAEVHAHAGHPFVIGSVKQLGTVLFDELKLPVHARTKTGYSTTAEVLDRLRPLHPIVDAVQRWRTLDKLVNTYTEVLVESVDPRDGRIHATFQQTASASGRLITTEPDLQRTPVRSEEFKEVRRGVVAPPGHVLLSADWSQIELRLLAHLSRDVRLLMAYREGADLHAATAAALFDAPASAVTPAQREVGKTVNFATIYGQGAPALAQQLGVSHREAKSWIDRFFQVYDGVARWRDDTVTRAYVDGAVRTLGGRVRKIPELSTGTWADRSYGERIAVNTAVQGSAADLCKVAMLRVVHDVSAAGLSAAMVLQIHDELLFEVPEAEVEATAAVVRAAMEDCWALEVPLVVEVGVGATWADAV